jgi:hypothetical protein
MILNGRSLSFVLLLVTAGAGLAHGQITGGINLPCSVDEVDIIATCLSRVFCAQPPSPIPAFDIGARSFATCPNQPVDNFAQVEATIGGVQAISTAQARALFFNRLIHKEIRGGDCQGNTSLLSFFDDPQGCNPPPPPPPDPGGCNNVGGDGFNPVDGGAGNDGCSPIIIDLSGNGFSLTSAANGISFDIAGSGRPIKISWTAPGASNGFLALPGSDGLVHNGKELFGNFTPQPTTAHPNGFLALAQYDASGDGVIDASDPIYSRLRLWIDANHDGISQPEELHTLPEMGVYSISLDYSLSMRTDEFGNVFRYKAKLNAGQAGASDVGKKAYDVFFVSQ